MLQHRRLSTTLPFITLLVVLLATFFIYRSGLDGPFVFDDGPNVVNNSHLKIPSLSYQDLKEAALSGQSGTLKRPVSMLSFALDYYWGTDPNSPFPARYPFKLTNLIIHLVNGIVVYALTLALVGAYRRIRRPQLPASHPQWLALAVAAAWLLHPLNLTGVLYVVQRMASLAALFTFLSLLCYVAGRMRLHEGQRGGIVLILLGALFFTPLAILSKENGALTPLFMLAAELTIFRFESARPSGRHFLVLFFSLTVLIPALLVFAFLATHPGWLTGGYLIRDFTLYERVLTECRAIWFYLRLIFLPSTTLMGIYHDDFAISHGLFSPATTFPAVLGIAGLVAAAWLLRCKAPLVAFGLMFFLIGHSMESTVLALELVHEHRNYLPIYGILLAGYGVLLDPLHGQSSLGLRRAFAVIMIVLFAGVTFIRAESWSTRYELWSTEVRHHPDSPRANIEMGDYIADEAQYEPIKMESNYLAAMAFYERASTLDRDNINGYFGMIRLARVFGEHLDPRDWMPPLLDRLEHAAIPANVNDRLTEASQCLLLKGCPLDSAQVETMLEATLRNPKVTGGKRAMVESSAAYYYSTVKHDYPAAEKSIRQAITLAPQDIGYRLFLVNILLAAHNRDEAGKQLALARQLDRAGEQTRTINDLEYQLSHATR